MNFAVIQSAKDFFSWHISGKDYDLSQHFGVGGG